MSSPEASRDEGCGTSTAAAAAAPVAADDVDTVLVRLRFGAITVVWGESRPRYVRFEEKMD